MINMFRSPSSKSVKDERRLLSVEVAEARNIKACSKPNISDPFVILFLKDLGGREIKTESFKTSQKSSTLAPIWRESFSFGQKYDLSSAANLPTLVATMYHKGAYSVSEVFLGQISIPLSTLSTSMTDMWYTLEPDSRNPDITGEIHLKLKFNRDPDASEEADESSNLIEQRDVEEGEIETNLDTSPNTVVVTIHSARNLPAMDKNLLGRATSSDPIVSLEIGGCKAQQSTVIKKNLNPTWNEEFTFSPVIDGSLSLQVTVEDYNDFTSRNFIGKAIIPLNDILGKSGKKSYRLKSKTMDADGVDRGEIDLSVNWKFDPKVAQTLLAQKSKAQKGILGNLKKGLNFLSGKQEDSEPDDDGDDVPDKVEEVKPETEEEKNKKKEEEENLKKSLADIDIKSGDYQIQVHIIEARDLKAENEDGTSDPVCYVECFGEKQHTQVIYGQTTCVFDELLIFNKKNLEKEEFQEGIIRIACRDSNSVPGLSNKMIGAFTIDAAQIYSMNKDHEMYRQWVPLMDDEDAEDVGVQGYLKISIQIIGPGEKIKVHDEAAELAKEMAREATVGGDISSLLLSVPTVRKEWVFIVCSIYRCEGLPVMDGKVGIGKLSVGAKTDAFCQLSFAGGKPIKSKIKTVFGESRAAINPEFNYDLWIPVSIPTMTQMIKFSVFDYDPEKNELIGNIVERYSNIDRCNGRKSDLRWYNMYGAPEFKQEKLLANIKKGGNAMLKVAAQNLLGDINWADYYNNVPDKASAFKGRALLRFRIESSDNRPGRHKTPEVVPFRKKIKPLPPRLVPETNRYCLHAIVFSGNDLPYFTDISLTGAITAGTKKQDLRVRISIGPYDLSTKPAKYEKGMCRWNEYLKSDPMTLPQDLSQIPDIFIYLVKEDLKPVCFTRVKAADLKSQTLLGFTDKAKWYLLQEDKSIDALNTDDFPGSLLIKLGFGLETEVRAHEMEWKRNLDDAMTLQSYQLRVHLYQGRNLPAADSNGLTDPFLKINFMGQQHKSKVIRKTLFPAFYQTIVFDNVMIPEIENFRYAPQITARLFDEDTAGSEYLGQFNFTLCDAFITKDPKTPAVNFPEPKWYNFFREVPGDGQGDLLFSVQLVPTFGNDISKETVDITPATRTAWVEMIAVGARDLAPFNFQPMQQPFLEIELNSFGTSFTASTLTSKKPNPSNPNFLEKIQMEVQLPEKSIYAAPLQLRCRDTRLGGYLKPIVGVGVIDLSTKLPWCPDTYRAPQTDLFFQSKEDLGSSGASAFDSDGIAFGMNQDPIAQQAKTMETKRKQEKASDELLATHEPPSIEMYVQQRTAIEDTGAGVFGALNHIQLKDAKKGKKSKKDIEAAAFSKVNVDEEDEDQPPAWSIARKKLPSELEAELQTTPFETYPLTRGKAKTLMGSSLKVVGKFKGLIRVKEKKDDPDIFSKELMDQLMKPKPYKVRLYVLNASALAKMDVDIFGNKCASDPYLKVGLGKFEFNDRKNAFEDATDCDFYKMIEIDCELPGTSQLVINVMDKDTIGKDDVIGKTTIDLEDRWFDARWQKYGEDNMRLPGYDPKNPTACRWATKPIERRSLYQPGQQIGQGILECWVDIMKPEVASAFAPDDVSLPPKQIFEVRVVIWKTKDVPPMDSLEKMSDLFVKCWPEGCAPQETDTHWRCKKGKASFNWRLLFDVELGHNTRAMKFPYLHLQLWDRDILKWNDCAGEGVINLGKYYRKAYKKNVALKLFEQKQGAMAKRAKQKKSEAQVRDPAKYDTTEDVPPPEPEPESGLAVTTNPMSSGANVVRPNHDADSDDDDEEHGVSQAVTSAKSQVGSNQAIRSDATAASSAASSAATVAGQSAKKASSGGSWFSWFKKDESEEDNQEEEESDPLLDPKDEEKEDEEEAMELINTFKSMTGLWEVDPPDSAWYHLEKADHNTGESTPMGAISYSVQIWPKDKAILLPAGAARSEPNSNPYCPPPVGRLKWSWNPFVLGSELCGPVLCAKLFCCLLCIAFVLLMVFCQPFLTIMINILFFFA